jgi:hypothetical protein
VLGCKVALPAKIENEGAPPRTPEDQPRAQTGHPAAYDHAILHTPVVS